VQITEVRIKLVDDASERLRAFCSVTFDDCFVVRDLKIIEGASGPFVAMPSRKLTFHCPECGSKNHLRAGYCNQCGRQLRAEESSRPPSRNDEGRMKLYADIAHPINSNCRELIQDRVIDAYEQELEVSKQPGYVSRYDEYGDEWEEADEFGADVDFPDETPTRQKADRSPSRTEAPVNRSEAAPRGPHKRPEGQKAVAPARHPPPDDFGAGIF
jgi:stage V sporulation protein G